MNFKKNKNYIMNTINKINLSNQIYSKKFNAILDYIELDLKKKDKICINVTILTGIQDGNMVGYELASNDILNEVLYNNGNK